MKKDGFIKWLHAQRDRNDPVGDLAADVKRDKRAPPVTSIDQLHARVPYSIRTILREAWSEYTDDPYPFDEPEVTECEAHSEFDCDECADL